MCIALVDQPHSVRVLGDEPMTMYLSVTPHVHPTHTPRTEDGERLPHNFVSARAYDVEPGYAGLCIRTCCAPSPCVTVT